MSVEQRRMREELDEYLGRLAELQSDLEASREQLRALAGVATSSRPTSGPGRASATRTRQVPPPTAPQPTPQPTVSAPAPASAPVSAPVPTPVPTPVPAVAVPGWSPSDTVPVRRPRQRRRGWFSRNWPVLLMALLVLAALGALGAWVATSAQDTVAVARQVQAQADRVLGDVEAGDLPAAAQGVKELAAVSERLHARTEQPAWRILEAVPNIGPDASALRLVAQSLADVSAAAEPLLPFAQRMLKGDLRTPAGGVDVAALQSVAPDLQRLEGVMRTSSQRLSTISDSAAEPAIANAAERLSTILAGGLETVARANEAARWLPPMLGAEGKRSWLVLFANPAEARGTGGFVGGFAVIEANQGDVRWVQAGTSQDLGTTAIPATGAPADSRSMWGDLLTGWNTYNLSPHFPLTGRLSADGMAVRGTPVSGVISLDPQSVAALLTFTGPVTYDDVTIDAGNAEQFFTQGIYYRFADDAVRNDVSVGLISKAFDALLHADVDPVALLTSLQQAVATGGVRMWSANASEQAWLEDHPIAGVLPDDPGPVIAVALNNAAANKVDSLMQTTIDYEAGQCALAKDQQSAVTVTLRNGSLTTPTKMLVHVYGPVAATYRGAALDGQPIDMYLSAERNRPVWWRAIELAPGEQRQVRVEFTEPTVTGRAPTVIPQSMVKDETITVTAVDACA